MIFFIRLVVYCKIALHSLLSIQQLISQRYSRSSRAHDHSMQRAFREHLSIHTPGYFHCHSINLDLYPADLGHNAHDRTTSTNSKSRNHIRKHGWPCARELPGSRSHHFRTNGRNHEHGRRILDQQWHGTKPRHWRPRATPRAEGGVLRNVEEAPGARHFRGDSHRRTGRRQSTAPRQPLLERHRHQLQGLLVRSGALLWKAGQRCGDAGGRCGRLYEDV